MTRRIATVLLFLAVLPASLCAQPIQAAVGGGASTLPLWPAKGDTSYLPDGQYVFFSPETDQWIVSYPEDFKNPKTSKRITLRFDSHKQVDPQPSVSISRPPEGGYSYTYTLENSGRARAPVHEWSLLVPDPDRTFEAPHKTWKSSRREEADARDFFSAASRLTMVTWSGSEGIGPGARSAFTVHSDHSPGFTTATFRGAGKSEYNDQTAAALPSVVAEQAAQLIQPAWDNQIRRVLGPRFPPGTSQFVVADNFQLAIDVLVKDGRLEAKSEFVKQTLPALRDYLSSGGATPFSANGLGFLSAARPGLESDIAAALKLSLVP
jgi:hypothetical protein